MYLSIPVLLLLVALLLAAGAFLGVLLGRRSSTANEVVDRIRARYEDEIAELRVRIRDQSRKDQAQD